MKNLGMRGLGSQTFGQKPSPPNTSQIPPNTRAINFPQTKSKFVGITMVLPSFL